MLKRGARHLASEDGMTLTELMVVLALLGVVIAAAYGAQYALQQANTSTERVSVFAQQITFPMLTLEKIIMQNREVLAGSNAYTLICTTDRNLDGVYERHSIYATTGGKIHVLTQLLDNSGNPVSTVSEGDIAQFNSNRAGSVPMFRYYDKNNVEITSVDLIPDKTTWIYLAVRSTVNNSSQVDTRTIQFRNRD